MPGKGIDEDLAFREVVERLALKHPGIATDRVDAVVSEVRAELAVARVRDFVPILAEREASRRLAADRI